MITLSCDRHWQYVSILLIQHIQKTNVSAYQEQSVVQHRSDNKECPPNDNFVDIGFESEWKTCNVVFPESNFTCCFHRRDLHGMYCIRTRDKHNSRAVPIQASSGKSPAVLQAWRLTACGSRLPVQAVLSLAWVHTVKESQLPCLACDRPSGKQ